MTLQRLVHRNRQDQGALRAADHHPQQQGSEDPGRVQAALLHQIVVAPGGTTTQNITFVNVGIILDVTPVISANNTVRLHMKPEVSLPGITTSAGPQIDTRNAETEVMIRDGETLVVGGLIDEQTRQNITKVPLLGDIPVLGAFFRSSFDQKNRTELLIFVTPRIVRD